MLLLAGAASRIHSAWRFRHMINLDAGVVALMAKHIAEGRPWPAFFYGQSHMGSLEALFSAFFCRIFGVSGFAVNLGTAVIAFGLLPITYFWAKLIAGPRRGHAAGLVALAFLCVGPGGFYHYNGSPRGGYASAITFGAFVLFYATRMSIRWAQIKEQRSVDFWVLGIGAGLAWWSSQLTTAAILSAAILLLAVLRLKVFSLRLLPGLLGFLLGSLPLWVHNIRHNWATFQLTGSFGRISFQSALVWFFRDRSRTLLIPSALPEPAQLFFILFYSLLCVHWLWMLARAFRSDNRHQTIGLGALALFSLVFASLYASSHFAVLDTPRYFLPMVAPLGVILSVSLVSFTHRPTQYAAGLASALVIITTAGYTLSQNPAARHQEEYDRIIAFGESAAREGIQYIHAPNLYRSWNFISRETIHVVDLWFDVYRPNAIAAEFHPNFAVLNNYAGIQAFLDRTGGKASRLEAHGHQVHHQFFPPVPAGEPLPSKSVRLLQDGTETDLREVLHAGRSDLFLYIPRGTPKSEIIWELEHPAILTGVRLWGGSPFKLPGAFKLTGQKPDGRQLPLLSGESMNAYFWSGPRPFWASPFSRVELRFPPRGLSRIHLEFTPRTPDHTVQLQHADLLLAGTAPPATVPNAVPMNLLKKRTLHSVYADRWESLRIHESSEGRIRTVRREDLFADSLTTNPESLRSGTGILADPNHRKQIRRQLDSLGAVFTETDSEAYVLFEVQQDIETPGLEWNGLFFFENPSRKALYLLERGKRDLAVSLYPELAPPLPPQDPLEIRFGNGVRLHEFRLETAVDVHRPKQLHIHALWEIPDRVDPEALAVFVHFRDEGGIRFQDDHVLLEDIPPHQLIHRPPHGRFHVHREISVPPEVSLKDLKVQVGLYERRNGQRLAVRTRLPQRHNAVRIPLQAKERTGNVQ